VKKCNIGGQGVLEGVMMRSQTTSGLAVRRATGEIVFEKEPVAVKKNWFTKLLFVRGVAAFVDMLGYGVKVTTKSAKLYGEEEADYKPSRFESFIAKKTGKDVMDIAMVIAVILAIALAIGIFFVLPLVLTDLIDPYVESGIVKGLIEGGIRLVIFLLYIIGISFMKDIKRVFRYHGAEHKTINCFEHEEPLTVESIQKYKTLHPRCGTSYLLLVIVISILLFSLIPWDWSRLAKFGLRLALLPVVAGIAYEFLKFAAHSDALFFRIIRWPGLMLQKLTTAPPDDSMVEVAVVAFSAAMNEMDDEALRAMADGFSRPPEGAVKKDEKEESTQPES
jgi:uncharacterized protein YqhQ